ncbi:YafY family transcriptional regulator [Legionella sp. 27cVA30]|nr:YafY family transcriptional regulator [Legionella sp. 27cVA30]
MATPTLLQWQSVSRTERLFALIQLLRCHRLPVSGAILAERLGVSLRTLYRDIATLQVFGAPIEGEPGMGYVLKPGFMLPPLMFSEDEIEAIVLGARWVTKRADSQLKFAAQNVLAKIAAILPAELQTQLETSSLLVPPGQHQKSKDTDLILIRQAIRRERKLKLYYQDLQGNYSERILWPIALGFFDEIQLMVAWCELRQDFRHFRTDRFLQLELVDIRYPQRRQTLLKKWRALNNIPQQ